LLGIDPTLNGIQSLINLNRYAHTVYLGDTHVAAGFGMSIDYNGEGYSGENVNMGKMSVTYIEPNQSLGYKTQFSIELLNDSLFSTLSEVFKLKYTGQLQLNTYGIGTHIGTPAYNLQVDALGNVIEGTIINPDVF